MEKLDIVKLGADNYTLWSAQLEAVLTIKSLSYVLSPAPAPAPAAAAGDPAAIAQGQAAIAEAAAKREADDAKAKTFLLLSVGPQHVGTVQRAKSAAEAWGTLKSVYAAQSTARQMQLKQELNLLVKGPGETLTEYITRATDLRDQLTSAGYEVREVEVVLSVLNGLPENYAMIRTVLEQKQDLRLLELLPNLLLVEARGARDTGTAGVQMERAFYSGRANPGSASSRRCWNCNQFGHFRSDCPQLKGADVRGAQMGTRGGGRGYGRPSGRGVGVPCTFAMGATAAGWNDYWVLDSGASHHVTGSTQALLDARPCTDMTITFGNGHQHKAELVGDVVLEMPFGYQLRLQDVLYVPGASANLFSISSATKCGARFSFGPVSCHRTQNNVSVGVAGRDKNGLYSLYEMSRWNRPSEYLGDTTLSPAAAALLAHGLPPLPAAAAADAADAAAADAQLWHRRLNHLGMDNMVRLKRTWYRVWMFLQGTLQHMQCSRVSPAFLPSTTGLLFPRLSVQRTPRRPCTLYIWTCAGRCLSRPWAAACMWRPSWMTTPSSRSCARSPANLMCLP